MSEMLPINIMIADRSYRLKIDAGDEEMVRKTAGLINDKITEFKSNFAGKDMQDYVSMALLWFATEQNNTGIDQVKWAETASKLAVLEKLVDKALANGE
jgi:cell division protein ZapA